MIEMEDQTSDLNEARIPFLDYKNYTDRVFFLPSKDGANDVMITGKLDIPEARRAIVDQALNQFSNLLNSKTFLINVRLASKPYLYLHTVTYINHREMFLGTGWIVVSAVCLFVALHELNLKYLACRNTSLK